MSQTQPGLEPAPGHPAFPCLFSRPRSSPFLPGSPCSIPRSPHAPVFHCLMRISPPERLTASPPHHLAALLACDHRNFHRPNASPSHHLTALPLHRLAASTCHLTVLPLHHVTLSPPPLLPSRHLPALPLHYLAASTRHLTVLPPHHVTLSPPPHLW